MVSRTNPKPFVAVVDNEPTICALIEELLSDEGYQVACYNDALNFVDELAHQTPDVLILDLHLGDQVSGWEILAKLRSQPSTSTIPVILSTADRDVAQIHKDKLQTSNTMILGKPFEIDDLLDMIVHALGDEQSRV